MRTTRGVELEAVMARQARAVPRRTDDRISVRSPMTVQVFTIQVFTVQAMSSRTRSSYVSRRTTRRAEPFATKTTAGRGILL